MATTVTENILEPSNVIEESGGVIKELTRTFRVDGLNDPTLFSWRESKTLASERIGTDRILVTATEVADVPRLGETHPDLDLLRVVKRRVRPTAGLTIGPGKTAPSHDSCYIDVDYVRLPIGNFEVQKEDVELGYVLEYTETSSTFKGNPIRLKGPLTDERETGYGPMQTPIVPVMRPRITASFMCMILINEALDEVNKSSDAAVKTKGVEKSIAKYIGDRLGRCNETKFMSFPVSGANDVGQKGSWLCAGIDSEFVGYAMDGGLLTNIKQYMNTFVFEHKEATDVSYGWLENYIYAEDPAHPGQRMDGITGQGTYMFDPDGVKLNITSNNEISHVARAKLYGTFDFTEEFTSIGAL